MRNLLLIAFLLAASLPLWSSLPVVRSKSAQAAEPPAGSVVCPPGIYSTPPSDCQPLGPSEILAQYAAQGITLPILPLPAFSPDRQLSDLPYQYFKVINSGGALFSSLDAAIANQPIKILYPSNDLYVSYIQDAVPTRVGSFYLTRSGAWVFADGGRLGHYDPPFQGLQFSSTPRNPFGWILGEVRSLLAPGVNAPESGHTHYRFQVVQIFTEQKVDNLTWYLIAPGEWVDSRQIARVDPAPVPPKGVTTDRWISVNLFEQTVSVYDHDRLVYATMASTGIDHFWTRPGLFQIQRKLETETMSNSDPEDFYYLEDVPWTMYFDEGRALHGAYWHNGFGYPHSHGCVNLSPGDAHWLFDWANVGEYVYVYDPSGRTPTDPSLYGSGAP